MWEFLLAPVDVLLSILFRQRENKDKYLDPDFPECLAAALCLNHTTPIQSQPLESDVIERLTREGCNAWGMVKPTYPGFKGRMLSGTDEGGPAGVTKVMTDKQCALSCMWSDLPIMAGSYGIKGKQGVYYEVEIKRMGGIIAIGNPKVCHRSTPSLTWFKCCRFCMPPVPQLEVPRVAQSQRRTPS